MSGSTAILIPVYNGMPFIERAVRSALEQTRPAAEVIVVDNASTDGTGDALAALRWHPGLRVVRNERNIGMFPNFNRALEHSAADYVKFLCADDELEPHALEALAAPLDRDPDVALVRGFGRQIDATGRELGTEPRVRAGRVAGAQVIRDSVLFMTNRYCNTPSHTLVRRAALSALGGFPETSAYHGWWNDAFTWLRLLHGASAHFLEEGFVLRRRLHAGQPTHQVYQRRLVRAANAHFRRRLLEAGVIGRGLYAASVATCAVTDRALALLKAHQRRRITRGARPLPPPRAGSAGPGPRDHRAPRAALSRCRICGVEGEARLHAVTEMQLGTGERFPYAECGTCGGLQLQEIPSDLGRYYPTDYYSFAVADDSPTQRVRRMRDMAALTGRGLLGLALDRLFPARAIHSLRRLRLPRSARMLDVGCGKGELLHALSAAGYVRLTGVDPHLPPALESAGPPALIRRALSEVDGRFDVIMFHHSLEHVPDPVAALTRARALLAPGGTCIVRVPTVSSHAWRRYGTDWVSLDAPRHIHLLSSDGIRRLAARTGFRIAGRYFDSTELQFWGSEQYRRGIPLLDARSYARSRATRLRGLPATVVYKARARRLNRLGRGDEVVVYLR